MFANFRRYMQVTQNAVGIAKTLTEAWSFTRKYQFFTLDVYNRLVKIAQKRGIKIPKTKIKMLAE
jgi:hypothetical protein